MSYLRSKIVEQAKSWIGCKESDGSHKAIIDVYNSYTPRARGYKVQYTDKWCATFVSACSIKCGYTDIIPPECSCKEMITLLKNINEWEESDSYTPSSGDIIFYDWDDTTGSTKDNTGTPDHVGIVEKVSGTTITVIEGMLNDDGYSKADFIVVEVIDYTIDATSYTDEDDTTDDTSEETTEG
ncbi:MAG: CHAP domain-containing protein [Clostridiales bacterium]|nr:CHAP domain-containing protein [Clostridiales bacterium]